MENDMKLSLIIPVYNMEQYVSRCINSIISEIKKVNFEGEVIIIDDGSTDRSINIVKQNWDDSLKWQLKIIKQKNSGVGFARNNGIKNAKGQYITFVDPDDYILDGYLTAFENARRLNDDVIVFSYFQKMPNKSISTKENKSYVLNCFYDNAVWNKFYKKSFLLENKISFIHSKVAFEDVGFTIQVLINVTKLRHINEHIYFYDNSRVNSTMNTLSKKRIFEMLQVLEDTVKKIDYTNLTVEKKEQIKYMISWHLLARHIPKFIKSYKFNVYKMSKDSLLYYRKIVKCISPIGINNIFDNEILEKDPTLYFSQKLGKNYITKLKLFYSGKSSAIIWFALLHIIFKISQKTRRK